MNLLLKTNQHQQQRLRTWSASLALGILVSQAFSFAGQAKETEKHLLITNTVAHPVIGLPMEGVSVWAVDGKIRRICHGLSAGQILEDFPEAQIEIVDAQGSHLYPGLIAPNTSLGLVEIDAVRATKDYSEVGQWTPDVQSWIAVNPDSEIIPVTRANGITHAQVTPQGGTIAGVSGVIALSGWTYEEMTVQGPAALHIYWPGFPGGLDIKKSQKTFEKSVEEIEGFFKDAEAYVEAIAEGAVSLTPAWEAMRPVLDGEIPVMIHADESRQIKGAVEWAEKRGLRYVIAGGKEAWKIAEWLGERRAFVVYESLYALPDRSTDPYDIHFTAPAKLAAAGVRVMFSEGLGGFGASFARNVPYMAAVAEGYGLSHENALKSLTLYPAMAFGLEDRLGTLEKGKEASMILVDGSVLDIRSNVKKMWIAGAEVSLESRQTRLYDKYSNRPLPDPSIEK